MITVVLVGPAEEQQFPIKNGDKITIEVDQEGQYVKFDLLLVTDQITERAVGYKRGETVQARLDFKRVK